MAPSLPALFALVGLPALAAMCGLVGLEAATGADRAPAGQVIGVLGALFPWCTGPGAEGGSARSRPRD